MLANLDFKTLQKICSTTCDNLRKMIAQLKKLNPKPGRGFHTTYTQIAVPEIIIKGNRECGFYPILNDAAIPKCFFQKCYINTKGSNLNNRENAFYSRNKRSALEIVNAIAKRKRLLLNVAEKILEYQYEFFVNGVGYLKPLVTTDIANKLGVNVSTISRICNKYMDTPHGVLEIKFFFSSKINAELMDNHHSSTAVKNRIKNLVANKQKGNILSDEAISKILREGHDIVISRRTVTKYREVLKIPSSAMRKRLSKMSYDETNFME